MLELEVAQANGEIDFPGCGPHPGESTLVAKNCDAVVMHVADPSYLRP